MNSPKDNPSRVLELSAAVAVSFCMVLLVTYIVRFSPPSPVSAMAAPVELPPIAVFPDFSVATNVDVKKQHFFDYLQDYIDAENARMKAFREILENYGAAALRGFNLSPSEAAEIDQIAETFRLDTEGLSDREVVAELMRRVDEIPASLVLAQAANESAWGTSRFTLEGNNIFGQWCYTPGCGIVPNRRISGATHEVQKFDSIAGAIESYFININSNSAYRYLRRPASPNES